MDAELVERLIHSYNQGILPSSYRSGDLRTALRESFVRGGEHLFAKLVTSYRYFNLLSVNSTPDLSPRVRDKVARETLACLAVAVDGDAPLLQMSVLEPALEYLSPERHGIVMKALMEYLRLDGEGMVNEFWPEKLSRLVGSSSRYIN